MVVSSISSRIATWSCLVILILTHLATNYAAVRAVNMRTLNRQRANLVLSYLLGDGDTLTPEQISRKERIFEWDGALRWKASPPFAKAKIGVDLQTLLHCLAPADDVTGTIRDTNLILQRLVKLFCNEDYLLWYDAPRKFAHIVLKKGASPEAQLKAWTLGLWVSYRLKDEHATSVTTDQIFQSLGSVLGDVTSRWDDYIRRLKTAGWDVDIANLETSSCTRFSIHGGKL